MTGSSPFEILADPRTPVAKLETELGLKVCDRPLTEIAQQATEENWTRDQTIQAHCRRAVS